MRYRNEIQHGKFLASFGAEHVWGWDTPAGKIRARRRAWLISDIADLKKGKHVLEIGCGSGLFTEMFAQSGAKITALDISEDILELARKRNLPEGQVVFLNENFESYVTENSFDSIVGSSILHHLNILTALKNIHRLLKIGGLIAFAEPNMLNPQIFFQKNIPFLKYYLGDSPDETAFFRFSIREKLEKIGFSNIQITPFDWLHPRTPPKLIELVQSFSELMEKKTFWKEFGGSLLISAKKSTGGSG